MPVLKEERPIGEIFTDFTQEIKTLFRDELQLFKIEMSHKMTLMGRHIGLIAAGGVVLFAGFLTLVAAAVAALAIALQLWAAALIIGLVVAAVGSYLLKKNLVGLKEIDLKPRNTIESVTDIKEEGKWLKKQV